MQVKLQRLVKTTNKTLKNVGIFAPDFKKSSHLAVFLPPDPHIQKRFFLYVDY